MMLESHKTEWKREWRDKWLNFTYKEASVQFISKPDSETLPKSTIKTGVKTGVKAIDSILLLLSDNPKMTLAEIASILDRSVSAIEQATKKLEEEGRLKRIGSKKGGHWDVVSLKND